MAKYILKISEVGLKSKLDVGKQGHQKLEFIFGKHQKLYVIDKIFYRPIINKCSFHFQPQQINLFSTLKFDVQSKKGLQVHVIDIWVTKFMTKI